MKKETVKTGFVNLVLAYLKGDDAEVKAIKIQKKAKAELSAQIAVKDAYTLSLEEDVELAEEALEMARINKGEAITNKESYIRNLLQADADLKANKKALKEHVETIDFLKKQLKIVSK